MTPEDKQALLAEIASLIKPTELTEEERQWVKLAIKKEAQSIALRQAVIEKSISSLIWSAIVGLGTTLMFYVQNHIKT